MYVPSQACRQKQNLKKQYAILNANVVIIFTCTKYINIFNINPM